MGLMPAADRCVGTRRRLVGATDLVECSSLTILPCASQASKYPRLRYTNIYDTTRFRLLIPIDRLFCRRMTCPSGRWSCCSFSFLHFVSSLVLIRILRVFLAALAATTPADRACIVFYMFRMAKGFCCLHGWCFSTIMGIG